MYRADHNEDKVSAWARSCVSRVPWGAAGGGPLLAAQGESQAALPSPPVTAAESGTRIPNTVGRAAFVWWWSLPLVCAATPRMGSVHRHPCGLRRYHTRGAKMNQKKISISDSLL